MDMGQHCQQAAALVSTWPEWKQNVLGGIMAKDKITTRSFSDIVDGYCETNSQLASTKFRERVNRIISKWFTSDVRRPDSWKNSRRCAEIEFIWEGPNKDAGGWPKWSVSLVVGEDSLTLIANRSKKSYSDDRDEKVNISNLPDESMIAFLSILVHDMDKQKAKDGDSC